MPTTEVMTISRSLRDAETDGWSQTWQTSVLGQPFIVQVAFAAVSGTSGTSIRLTLTVTYGSFAPWKWQQDFQGDLSYNVALFSGIDFQMNITQWQITPNAVSFQLTVKVCPILCVTLYRGNVTVPLTGPHLPAHLAGLDASVPMDVARLSSMVLGPVVSASCDDCGCTHAVRNGFQA